jgi:transcriptional regulator with XRE-family HTH domain
MRPFQPDPVLGHLREYFTLRELADLMGVNERTLERWAAGSRPMGPVSVRLLHVIAGLLAEHRPAVVRDGWAALVQRGKAS